MKLYEFVCRGGGEYIFIIAKSKKRAIKLANENSDIWEPDYREEDIINDELSIDPLTKEGLYEKIIM